MKLTLLGTGTSFGVPVIGCDCAVCRSADPRDRRTRCAAVLEHEGHTLLIDTPPELRLQLLAARIGMVDAVLFTHAHADHIAGIDDLRAFSDRRGGDLPLYGSAETLAALRASHRYIFDDGIKALPGTTKPQLALHQLVAGRVSPIAGIDVLPLAFPHGHLTVLGFRFGDIAYITDVKAVPPEVRDRLRGLKLLVLNALRYAPHPTHLSIDDALAVVADLAPERTLFTHLTHETGHAELAARLPAGVEPGYDGLSVEIR
ncbi:MAG TPA: MBL fold metallo-hydrolase [Gemmatimonadales bacterium]|nr:MBL fold metallo-hydrolase [Gemmatimonadales bacterium]